MKNKRIMAIIFSAVMAISVCVPMSGMSAFAADIAEELNAETAVDVEDAETALEEEEAVSPESEETAEPENSDVPEELNTEDELPEEQEAAEQIANGDEVESDIITTEENAEAILEEAESAEVAIEEPVEQDEAEELEEIAEPEQTETDREAKSAAAAGTSVAQAIWTEGNTKLTFYYGPLVSVGNTFKGYKVTGVWSGTAVTNSGNETPGWAGWDSSVAEDMTSVVFDTSFLAVKPTSMHEWFYYCQELKSIDTRGLDTSKVTDMKYLFSSCKSLTSIDLSGFNTANVTDMNRMFEGCSSLTSLNVSGFNTSKVTDMTCMFENCKGLTSLDLSGFDTSNVTDMSAMFFGCAKLKSLDLSKFNTSKVTDMNCMFISCSSLTSLKLNGFNTSKVTDMAYMFSGCESLTSLDVSSFNTSNVDDMYSMFNGLEKLKSLDLSGFDTSKVTNMEYMFGGCSGLTSLNVSKFKTSNVTKMTSMFAGCSDLTSLDLSSFDMSSVKRADQMLAGCYDLKTIYCSESTTDWKCSASQVFYLSYSLIGKDGVFKVAYDSTKIDGSMAKAASLGGYFTPKNSTAVALGKTTRGDMFNLANNVKVTWKEVPGAKYYKVYREGITDTKETRKDPVIVTTGLVGWDKEAGLTNGHAYRYKIVASTTGKGDSSGDSPLSYSKVMYRLKTVVIRSVKNTAAGKVTVKYDKTTSGDSYVLQYCEREDMVGAKTKVVLGANNTSYTIGGLKKGKTYYISIRVRKKVDGIDYYTTFGVPKKIKITQ